MPTMIFMAVACKVRPRLCCRGSNLEGNVRNLLVVLLALVVTACISEESPDEVLSEETSSLLQSEMDCYIDTPAYDEYSANSCIAAGSTTVWASFRLRPATPACGYNWYYHPECTTDECSVQISPGQNISLYAYYYACGTGTPTEGALATARYIRNW